MVEQFHHLGEDLRGLIEGDVLLDPVSLAVYSSDSSLHEILPLAVVCPKHTADVQQVVRFASERSIPVIPRGAGTGTAGGAIGQGIILDFARYMHAILEVGEKHITVQSGALLSQINSTLNRWGKYFPPDPAKFQLTTIGGMIGVDATGSHSIHVGSTRDYLLELEVVLANGHKLTLTRENMQASSLFESGNQSQVSSEDSEVKRNLLNRVAGLLQENADLIDKYQPAVPRNTSGYYLKGILQNQILDLPKLIAGSEGTLAIVTQVKLAISEIPENRAAAFFLFTELQKAIEAVQIILSHQPSACDLLDRRVLTLAREAQSGFQKVISPDAEAALIVEFTDYTQSKARDRMLTVMDALCKQYPGMQVGKMALTSPEIDHLWSLPQAVVPYLTRLKGSSRPVPIIEDIAIPPDQLSPFMKQAQKVLQRHNITSSLYAHAASGQLHIRPFLNWPIQDDGRAIEAMARELYQVVFDYGGSMSGEHGDGLSRTSFVRSQYGPLYRVFQRLKSIFDPEHLLNPNKIVSDDTSLTRRFLRTGANKQLVDLELNWQPGELNTVVSDCNGCGVCRTTQSGIRMCPFYHLEQHEIASPRAKANAFRQILSDKIPENELNDQSLQELSKRCFNCKQCQVECPSQVNIPDLVTEAKAQYVKSHGLTRSQWFLSRLQGIGQFACKYSWLVNRLIKQSTFRYLLQKIFGLSKKRELPPFVKEYFLKKYEKLATPFAEPCPAGVERVVYFVDYFANFHDPLIARSFLEILKHHQIECIIPGDQLVSGMAMVSLGDLDSARKVAEHNLRILAPFAREGYRIVCTEPSAAICLKMEYPRLSTHPDVQVVAKQTMEAGEYLLHLQQRGLLKTDVNPLARKLAYHLPCHVRALSRNSPFYQILQQIPNLQIHHVDRGCTGMAGPFGLARENYQTSLKIGEPLLDTLKANSYDSVLAECSSCRMQISEVSKHHTLHPLKLLVMAYGIELPGNTIPGNSSL